MANETIKPYETKMQKSLDALEREYTTIRAGRANPHILDKLKVDYYGTPTPLQQVGNVTVPEARVLMIQPWESKLIKDIKDARGQLFFDYIRILKEFQPKFFLAENVSGMLANRHSIAVKNILELFDGEPFGGPISAKEDFQVEDFLQ